MLWANSTVRLGTGTGGPRRAHSVAIASLAAPREESDRGEACGQQARAASLLYPNSAAPGRRLDQRDRAAASRSA
jgi:hypothetical protein